MILGAATLPRVDDATTLNFSLLPCGRPTTVHPLLVWVAIIVLSTLEFVGILVAISLILTRHAPRVEVVACARKGR